MYEPAFQNHWPVKLTPADDLAGIVDSEGLRKTGRNAPPVCRVLHDSATQRNVATSPVRRSTLDLPRLLTP